MSYSACDLCESHVKCYNNLYWPYTTRKSRFLYFRWCLRICVFFLYRLSSTCLVSITIKFTRRYVWTRSRTSGIQKWAHLERWETSQYRSNRYRLEAGNRSNVSWKIVFFLYKCLALHKLFFFVEISIYITRYVLFTLFSGAFIIDKVSSNFPQDFLSFCLIACQGYYRDNTIFPESTMSEWFSIWIILVSIVGRFYRRAHPLVVPNWKKKLFKIVANAVDPRVNVYAHTTCNSCRRVWPSFSCFFLCVIHMFFNYYLFFYLLVTNMYKPFLYS